MIAPMRIEWVDEWRFWVVMFDNGAVHGNYRTLAVAEEEAIAAHEAEEARVAA